MSIFYNRKRRHIVFVELFKLDHGVIVGACPFLDFLRRVTESNTIVIYFSLESIFDRLGLHLFGHFVTLLSYYKDSINHKDSLQIFAGTELSDDRYPSEWQAKN